MTPGILLVDDNPEEIELALHAFAARGHANGMRTVRTVAAALQAVASSLPGLILLDLKLAGESGLDLLGRLKADPATVAVPVVVLTASRERRDVLESYRLGANAYVVKPVDFDDFADLAGKLGDFWLGVNELPGRG